MLYTRLGTTGLIVSKLCLGTMTFGSNSARPALGRVDEDNARLMVERSRDAGINFFDTADGYNGGQSETIVGKLLKPVRQDVVIATKVGFRTGAPLLQAGLSRQRIFTACEASLRRLGTDYIDLYIVHKEDPFTPLEETLEALNDLVRAGKVRYLGYSNWSAWRAAKALQIQKANGWATFNSGQMHYSLLVRDVEHDMVPCMLDGGIGLTVWSPLAGGFLSGKYTRENLSDGDNRLSSFDIVPFDREHGFALVEKIRAIADRHQATVAQVALAWLLAKPVVASIIVGAAKQHQLEDNLAAAALRLEADDVDELDRATAPAPLYPHWFNARQVDPQQRAALGE